MEKQNKIKHIQKQLEIDAIIVAFEMLLYIGLGILLKMPLFGLAAFFLFMYLRCLHTERLKSTKLIIEAEHTSDIEEKEKEDKTLSDFFLFRHLGGDSFTSQTCWEYFGKYYLWGRYTAYGSGFIYIYELFKNIVP